MFQLHDKTRRRICMAGFILFCVAPTLGAALWSAARHLPWTAREEEQTLGNLLGLEVRMAGMKHLRPDAVLYENIELADPETNQLLLRCRLLEAQWKTIADAQGMGKPTLILSASQPEVEAAGLNRLGGLLQRVMQAQTPRPAADVRISAAELTLKAGVDSQTLTGLEASIDNPPGGVQAILAFRIAGVDMPEPVKIRAIRNRQTNPPTNGFELSTGRGDLTCDLLAAGLPDLGSLGLRCRFRGYIWANQERTERGSENWSGELTGRFSAVDLDRLVGDRFPHKLSGLADITVQSAQLKLGRLTEASGTIVAGPGVVSRSLLLAAARNMNLQNSANLNLLGDQITYDRLALDVALNSRGLSIAGRCPSAQNGAIMTTDRQICLLSATGAQYQPVATLIRTLAPESAAEVPVAYQTDWLITHLPMPQSPAPQTREASLPPAHLRLKE
jgi:hypothetical protein